MSAPVRFRSVARTDTGLVRSHNEDSLVDRPDVGLWAVADGMGGHVGGEQASGLIRDALRSTEPEADLEVALAEVTKRLHTVHGELRTGGRASSGSTVIVLLARGEQFVCGWAGDSRLYRWRSGKLERLSHDHSLVQELVDSGTLTPEAAYRHPLKNRITRAVGMEERLRLDVARGQLRPGDRFLLCSDGLHGVLTDGLISKFVAVPDLDDAVDGMMQAVLKAGAPDNVAIVLVAVEAAARA